MDFVVLDDLLNINSLEELDNKYKKYIDSGYKNIEFLDLMYEYIKKNYSNYAIAFKKHK